jgi:dTDP-4-dehydrorhamnose reductase
MPTYSNILITGGSGFLGWNLATVAASSYDVAYSYHQHQFEIAGCQEYALDFQNQRAIETLVDEVEPEVIIHTAALANVDVCEQRRSLAYETNVGATETLVRCAEERACRFIYISTDLVFDGQAGNYCETDPTNPLNYYAETKLLGEQAVSAHSTNYLILRMALMYGLGNGVSSGFTTWIQNGLQHEQPVRLYVDQYRSPLWMGDGVKAILELLEYPKKNEIYHIAGSERINRYDFGKQFAHTFGYDEKYLQPVYMEKITSNISRGKDCSLNIQKVQSVLSFSLSDAATGLQRMKSASSPKKKAEH